MNDPISLRGPIKIIPKFQRPFFVFLVFLRVEDHNGEFVRKPFFHHFFDSLNKIPDHYVGIWFKANLHPERLRITKPNRESNCPVEFTEG